MQVRNEPKTRHKIIDRIMNAVKKEIAGYEKNIHCYSFEVCFNPLAHTNWFLRFIKADVSNPDKVKESFTYFCFNKEAELLDCSPIFEKQQDQALFFESMITVMKYARL